MLTVFRILILLEISPLYPSIPVRDGNRVVNYWDFNEESKNANVGPPPRYHTTDQDHFDGANVNTWQQAYYVNDTFWSPGNDSPVFLRVGGEFEISGSYVCGGTIYENWIEKKKGLLFGVEHRYYGCHNKSACPVNFDEKKPLQYLSSRQALADLAKFHEYATKAYGLTSKNKWIVVGGSYPGMLASWARLKFPNLFNSAVATSAPVEAQLNMHGYNDVTARAYAVSDNLVGGSSACESAIRKGHVLVGDNLKTDDGRKLLASLFNLKSADWLKDPSHQLSFAGWGVAYFPSQGNRVTTTRPAGNIKSICSMMINATLGDELHRLSAVAKAQHGWSIPKWDDSLTLGVNWDYWGYQTCTEFAFYQTCDVGSECFYTQGLLTLDTFTKDCKQYGLTTAQIQGNVQFTNDYYGGDLPSGSRVIYPNGEVDPWHSLGVLKSPDPTNLPTYWVPGASHCAWLWPSIQPSVTTVRDILTKQVDKWLAN